MNTKVNEGKLISGKEALIALANGQEIEARHKQTGMGWSNAMTLNLFSFKSSMFEFRLKPRTIKLEFRLKQRTIKLELEIPAPFKLKKDEKAYRLAPTLACGYTGFYFSEDENEWQFGSWRTEEEIKQVVAVLRQVFGGSHDN